MVEELLGVDSMEVDILELCMMLDENLKVAGAHGVILKIGKMNEGKIDFGMIVGKGRHGADKLKIGMMKDSTFRLDF